MRSSQFSLKGSRLQVGSNPNFFAAYIIQFTGNGRVSILSISTLVIFTKVKPGES